MPLYYSQDIYNEDYFKNYRGGVPYERSEPHWGVFFGNLADAIIREFKPKTVFDAGCAKGFLVEALRERNVEAYGRDFSEYAIGDIPDTLRPFCTLGSIADSVEGQYDLITCIDVLEHMPVDESEKAIANLCNAAPLILFSSSLDEFSEPSHVNVRTPLHWLKLFAQHNFAPYHACDPSFLYSCAMVLERRELAPSFDELLSYAKLVSSRMERQATEEQHDKVAHEHLFKLNKIENELTSIKWELKSKEKELISVKKELIASNHKIDCLLDEINTLSTSHQDEINAINISLEEAEINKTRLFEIERSTSWKMTAPLRNTISKIASLRRRLVFSIRKNSLLHFLSGSHMSSQKSYEEWVKKYDTLDASDIDAIKNQIENFEIKPLISIIMPTYNTPKNVLIEAIDSVVAQIYENWELCIADDASTMPHVKEVLESYSKKDSRIKIIHREKNGHISAASNSALSIATGEWIALLDHDDVLAPHALFCVVEAINRNADACLIYSDEDKIGPDGMRCDPYFKSDWNETLFLSQNMFCHLGVIRADIMRDVNGFRQGFEGSQDYDLILRCLEKIDRSQIIHIPHILYHWRIIPGSTALQGDAKPYAHIAAKKALNEYYKRNNLNFETVEGETVSENRLMTKLDNEPSVSIIIPTRNGLDILSKCIKSIVEITEYKNYKIVIVDNNSDDINTLNYFKSIKSEKINIIKDEREFNYSQLNNFAVYNTNSEYICFLNNDTEVISAFWLREMVGLAHNINDAGVVGAKLLYPDRTVQHAGVIIGMGGVAGHYAYFDERDYGYFSRARLVQEYSALTFACTLVKRKIFDEVGGLDEENLKVAFNDVDFCLKVKKAGYRNIWTPFALLFHHESKTRGYEDSPEKKARFSKEVEFMQSKWGSYLHTDTAYSPNLSLNEPFKIAFPPRVPKPWKVS